MEPFIITFYIAATVLGIIKLAAFVPAKKKESTTEPAEWDYLLKEWEVYDDEYDMTFYNIPLKYKDHVIQCFGGGTPAYEMAEKGEVIHLVDAEADTFAAYLHINVLMVEKEKKRLERIRKKQVIKDFGIVKIEKDAHSKLHPYLGMYMFKTKQNSMIDNIIRNDGVDIYMKVLLHKYTPINTAYIWAYIFDFENAYKFVIQFRKREKFTEEKHQRKLDWEFNIVRAHEKQMLKDWEMKHNPWPLKIEEDHEPEPKPANLLPNELLKKWGFVLEENNKTEAIIPKKFIVDVMTSYNVWKNDDDKFATKTLNALDFIKKYLE